MSVLALYAGSTSSMTVANNQLPSPKMPLKVSIEQIWSEDTGRAQSGENKAKMIGESLTSKHTYTIEWQMLTLSNFQKITQLMPRGFFYFGVGSTSAPPSDPSKYYRSEIQYDLIQVGSTRYYQNVNVTVIEQ